LTRKNRANIFLIMIAVVAISLIFQYAGDFLFVEPQSLIDSGEKPVQPLQKSWAQPVKYNHLSRTINGLKQEINILEVNLQNEHVHIKPVLSFDKIFGFEKLSKIVERKGAYAAVNSGIFYKFGRPSGMLVIDGELISNSTGKYPVFTVLDREAVLAQINTVLWIEYSGKRLKISNINAPGNLGDIVLYTPAYGTKNRAGTENITAAIENGIVTDISKYSGSASLPQNGMLLTFYLLPGQSSNNIPIRKGDKVKFSYDSEFSQIIQAYECGSWIVKDGEVVIGDKDEWVGVMTNRDPRTVIGLKDKHRVVLLTVDGRQPGYSAGFTGKELGQFLLGLGIKNAAMLDGGSSTEMIIKNQIINKPSYKGLERPLGGAMIVQTEY